MKRAALALLVTTASVTVLHAHKRPAPASNATLAPVLDLPHTSRDITRLPLHPSTLTKHSEGAKRRPAPRRPRPSRPAGTAAHLSDVTMYCPTDSQNAAGRWPRVGDVAVLDRSIPFGTRVVIAGNVYTVEDWIGSGSDYDIYGGTDHGCEQRALRYGRHHVEVVVER